jgi:hypothetical protein
MTKTYRVHALIQTTAYADIEAANEDEARTKAYEMSGSDFDEVGAVDGECVYVGETYEIEKVGQP